MKKLKRLYSKLRSFFGIESAIKFLRNDVNNSQLQQLHLFYYYKNLKDLNLPLPKFNETGFRVYSQNDEDGKLLYIFSQIGFTTKTCVDMAFGNPYGANVTNLICNWGFNGLLVEGSSLEVGKQFFYSHPDTWIYPPKLVQTWITAENVNEICKNNGFSGEIDLFSLDIDGVDYYIWKALTEVKPRVMVCEYANFIPKDKSITVPYKSDFCRFDINPDFFSASLLAYVNLSREKGYRLIGCNKYGFNAFFLRNDIAADIFPEVSVEECLKHPQSLKGQEERFVKDLPWVEV